MRGSVEFQRRMQVLLGLLYLLFALPVVVLQVYATPPIQVADEENHFLRALQISNGDLIGHTIDANHAGGRLDPLASTFAHSFDELKFHPERKFDLHAYADAETLRWNSGPPQPAIFGNTAIYPFFLYLPASLALDAGRLAHWSILNSFYMARLAMALVATGMASVALMLCGRGATLLFVLLSFPMVLSLFASVSQDAMSIALGAFAVATWSRAVTRGEAISPGARAVVSLALGAVAAARVPLLPLAGLALLPTRAVDGRSRPGLSTIAAALAGSVPFAIGVLGARAAKVPFRAEDGVSPFRQLLWMAHNPLAAWHVAVDTLAQNGVRHLREAMGVLGWLDAELPRGSYTWLAACLVIGTVAEILTEHRNLDRPWRYVPVALAAIAAVGVFGALYLAWTPVGAPVVDGVQGRYFLVPAMVAAVALPSLLAQPMSGQAARLVGTAKLALCVIVGLVNLWIVPMTILRRYYG